MIAPRGGVEAVRKRLSALRSAVVAEVEDMNRLIFHVLRAGVILSVSFLLFGFLLSALGGGPLPERSLGLRLLPGELAHLTTSGFLNFGILLMILTPVTRVFLSILAFAEERDRTYVALTGIVFANLMASLLIGLG